MNPTVRRHLADAYMAGDAEAPAWFTRDMVSGLLQAHDYLVRVAGRVATGETKIDDLLDELQVHIDVQKAAIDTMSERADPASLRHLLVGFLDRRERDNERDPG